MAFAETPTSNTHLALLSRNEWSAWEPAFERVIVKQRQELVRPDEPHAYLWFPESGVYSQVVGTSDGAGVDVFIFGNEGVLGVPALFGAPRAISRTIAQFDATLLRIPLPAFLELVPPEHRLFRSIERYAGTIIPVLAQISACNRLHSSEQRLCRWLLSVCDRLGQNDFQITHEFLALMLGTRRASITEVAHGLQDRGFIRYERRFINILDARALRRCACECYGVISGIYRSSGFIPVP